MINARVKIFFKSLGESIAALLVAIAVIAGAMGGVWILFNAPAGVAIAIIVLGIVGGLTYYQYKEKLNELKYIEERLKETQEEITHLEEKIASITDDLGYPREVETNYWNNLLKDAQEVYDRLIKKRDSL